MIWNLDFTDNAKKDIAKLKKSEKQAYQKLMQLLAELIDHPMLLYPHTAIMEINRYIHQLLFQNRR